MSNVTVRLAVCFLIVISSQTAYSQEKDIGQVTVIAPKNTFGFKPTSRESVANTRVIVDYGDAATVLYQMNKATKKAKVSRAKRNSRAVMFDAKLKAKNASKVQEDKVKSIFGIGTNQKRSSTGAQNVNSLAPLTMTKLGMGSAFSGVLATFRTPEQAIQAVALLRSQSLRAGYDHAVMPILDRSRVKIGADVVNKMRDASGNLITGKGRVVAILDTGVDYTHADFGKCKTFKGCSKFVAGYDFVENDADPYDHDDVDHGTHVASIVAGNGSSKGIAPDAKLAIFRVLTADGGYDSDILKGLDRVVDLNGDGNPTDKADVLNMSLGSAQNDPDDIMSLTVDRIVKAGVVAAIAAGNSGPSHSTIGVPGDARFALTVGASSIEDDGSEQVADFSSRGPIGWQTATGVNFLLKPEVVAPGVTICAARGATSTVESERTCPKSDQVALSGTSMASPHVAGLAALVKQAHPDFSAIEIRQSIINSAKVISKDIVGQGFGRIRAVEAVNLPRQPVAVITSMSKVNKDMKVAGTLYTSSISGGTATVSIASLNDAGEVSSAYTQVSKFSIKAGEVTSPISISATALDKPEYVVKVTFKNAQATSSVLGYFNFPAFTPLSPLPGDVINKKSILNLQLGTDTPALAKSFSVSVGAGSSPKSWKPLTSTALDTSTLASGFNTIRFQPIFGKLRKIIDVPVYADPTLLNNYPVRIPIVQEGNPFENPKLYYDLGDTKLPTTSIDLNADGSDETVVVVPANPPRLVAYDKNASKVLEKTFGEVLDRRTDINNRGVIASHRANGSAVLFTYDSRFRLDGSPSYYYAAVRDAGQIYAFDNKGAVLPGWPVKFGVNYASDVVSLMAVDMDGDGDPEIVASTPSTISIFDIRGKLLGSITNTVDVYFQKVLAARLHAGLAPKILVERDDTTSYDDGSEFPVRKVSILALDIHAKIDPAFNVHYDLDFGGTVDMVAGDIDHDGNDDVVIETSLGGFFTGEPSGKIDAFSANNKKLWTYAFNVVGDEETLGKLLLSDRSNDGTLETTFCRSYQIFNGTFISDGGCTVINSKGINISDVKNIGFTQTPAIVAMDLTGDKKQDYVGIAGTISTENSSSWAVTKVTDGGLFAFDGTGGAISSQGGRLENSSHWTKSPAICDANGDGIVDIVSSSDDDSYKYNGDSISKDRRSIFDWSTGRPVKDAMIGWYQNDGDIGHTSHYPPLNVRTVK